MAQVMFEGHRFHTQAQFAMYEKESKEVGMFKLNKPILKAEIVEHKAIIPLLEAIKDQVLKGTVIKAWIKNDDGNWDYCTERFGTMKGDWGGNQTAESKASHAQKGLEVVGG